MTVDVRTRVDGEQAPVDAGRFFETDLPDAFEAHADLLGDAPETLRLLPLVVEVDGEAWTLRAEGGRVEVAPGATADDGALYLRIDATQLSDLVGDQVTPMGWFSSGGLDLRGRLERLLDW